MNKSWEVTEMEHWKVNDVLIGRAVSSYSKIATRHQSDNERDTVRLHVGLRGDYSFACPQLKGQWDLIGGHHNIIYSDGITLNVSNKSKQIETFGVEFPKQLFIDLIADHDPSVSAFCKEVVRGESALLSHRWGSLTLPIQTVIDDIVYNPYKGSLQNLYLFGKALELLVLCISEYKAKSNVSDHYIKTKADKEAIIAARDFINDHLSQPPSLSEIARQVGINEFKLKYGFKEMFGMPLFSYLIEKRLSLATLLLRDTDKSLAEIANELGYSSPQHFSAQFKEKRRISPSEVRKSLRIENSS